MDVPSGLRGLFQQFQSLTKRVFFRRKEEISAKQGSFVRVKSKGETFKPKENKKKKKEREKRGKKKCCEVASGVR